MDQNNFFNEWMKAINDEQNQTRQNNDMTGAANNGGTQAVLEETTATEEQLMLPPAPVAAAAAAAAARTSTSQQQERRGSSAGKRTARASASALSRIKRQRSEQSTGSAASTDSNTPVVITQNPTLTGRPPTMLYLSADYLTFSPYQIMIRKHVEFFEANAEEVAAKSPMGGARAIVLGQVGVRCRFCGAFPPSMRASGAVIYPSKRSGVYQAAQNIANSHWWEHCGHLPLEIRTELMELKNAATAGSASGSRAGSSSNSDKQQRSGQRASKSTWSDRATALGVYEDQYGLRFAERLNAFGFPSG